jgi:phage shock protein PspC (stress-responsive transcriptional regulator)
LKIREPQLRIRELTMPRTLARSRRHRMIFGVCGGLAEYLGWDPTVVRVVYVLASVFSAAFPGMLVYLILWAVMPEAEG